MGKKEFTLRVVLEYIPKPVKIPYFVNVHRGEVKESILDKGEMERYLKENRRNYFFQKGENEETVSYIQKREKEYREDIEHRYEEELRKYKEQIKKSMNRLTDKGKNFLYKIEDMKNSEE